jgi:hypothetical protein
MGFQSRELCIAFTKMSVTWICNINYSPIQSALECGYEHSLARGRLSELSGDKIHTLVSYVGDKVQQNKAENRIETVALLRRTFLVRLHSRMSRFIRVPTDRRDVEMKSAQQENTTLQLLGAYLEAPIESTQPRAHNVGAEFVFNLDESRTSELEDRIGRKYAISWHAKRKTIFHGIHGGVKHVSSVVSI